MSCDATTHKWKFKVKFLSPAVTPHNSQTEIHTSSWTSYQFDNLVQVSRWTIYQFRIESQNQSPFHIKMHLQRETNLLVDAWLAFTSSTRVDLPTYR